MSFVVVIKGPLATAGLIFNWFNTRGVIVPIKLASITTAKSDNDTVMDNMIWPESTNKEHPKANIAAINALMSATKSTFWRRFHNVVSKPLLSAKDCTINEEDWIPTFPPVEPINGIKAEMAGKIEMVSSKRSMILAAKNYLPYHQSTKVNGNALITKRSHLPPRPRRYRPSPECLLVRIP